MGRVHHAQTEFQKLRNFSRPKPQVYGSQVSGVLVGSTVGAVWRDAWFDSFGRSSRRGCNRTLVRKGFFWWREGGILQRETRQGV